MKKVTSGDFRGDLITTFKYLQGKKVSLKSGIFLSNRQRQIKLQELEMENKEHTFKQQGNYLLGHLPKGCSGFSIT